MKEEMRTKKYETVPCILCGSTLYTVVYPSITTVDAPLHMKYSAAQGILCTDQVVTCNSCSLLFVNPRLSSETIIDACAKGDDEVYVSQGTGRMETFKKGLRLVEKFSPQKGKLLDVGAAAGFFMNVAKNNGWEVSGVEPNTWLCEYGKKHFNIPILPTTLEHARYKKSFFDVVTIWDVIEHIPHPERTLHEIQRILKPGGIFILSTPNADSVFFKIFGRKWWFFLSHHLFYFSPKTIKIFLRKEGFTVLSIQPHWQSLQIGYMFTMFRKLNQQSFLGTFAGVIEKVLRAVKLYNLKITYYAGQMDIVARK